MDISRGALSIGGAHSKPSEKTRSRSRIRSHTHGLHQCCQISARPIRDLSCRRFPSSPARAGRRRGHTVLLLLVFAFLRNAFICGVLQYLADASGSVTLQIFAIIAYVALAAYCLSYVNVWVLTPFHFVKHKRLGFWLDALVTLAVLLSLGYAILAGTSFAIDEIAKGHAASRTNGSHNSAVHAPGQ